MKRVIAWELGWMAVAAVLMVGLIVGVLLALGALLQPAPAKSTTSQGWRPAPTALFSRWPTVPVDAGSSAGTPPLAYSGSRTSVPSILPSGRTLDPGGVVPAQPGGSTLASATPPHPTANPRLITQELAVSGTIPPYVAEKGVAGISPLSHGVPNGRVIQGIATFYQYVPGQAAAAARLRDNLGPDWRFATVQVCHAGRCLSVVLTDYESSGIPGRLIDLSSTDFLTLCGPLSRGICSVEVTHG